MGELLELDRTLFTAFNGQHTPFWDGVLVFVSRRESWWGAYAVLVVALAYYWGRQARWQLPLVSLTVWLADSVSSGWFKPFFHRLRPCHAPELAASIRMVEGYGCGGLYGFMSSHAANTAALAAFLWWALPPRFRVAQWLVVLWSLLTGYSRIYLGAHYPGDVLSGWLLGATFGWGAAYLGRRLVEHRPALGG